jgi:hypothetical protein
VTDQPHWDWLHGPATKPDPSVNGMSASAAHRHTTGFERALWDLWLNQPVRDVLGPWSEGDAA